MTRECLQDSTGMIIMHKKDRIKRYAIIIVCDFTEGLSSRILDVYRFFRTRPQVVLARRGKPIETDSRLDIQYEHVPIPLGRFENLRLSNAPAFAFSTMGYLLYSFFFYIRFRKMGIRLVHAHVVFPQGLFGLVIARLLRVPLVVTASGGDVYLMMQRSSLLRAVCCLVLKHASVTIPVSEPLQARLRNYGVSNTIHVPNSVDLSSIRTVNSCARDDSLLFVGSMTQNKRPLVLLQAFDIVAKAIPTATLYMYGKGPLMEALSREIARRGLVGRVKGLTCVNQQTLNRIRAKTAIFVLPSATEGLSLALLEAMAAGQAVIASRNESHEAILRNGENALLFEADDSEGLARQIMLAIRDRALRRRISRSARTLLENEFSNSVVAERLESVYLGTLNKGAFN
jgi:glycosyltransferase involved in cell wall biosynthesis